MIKPCGQSGKAFDYSVLLLMTAMVAVNILTVWDIANHDAIQRENRVTLYLPCGSWSSCFSAGIVWPLPARRPALSHPLPAPGIFQ